MSQQWDTTLPTALSTVPPPKPGLDEEPIQQSDEEFTNSTLQWIPPPPSFKPSHVPQLQKPVVIPRLDVNGRLKGPLPFLRAYSPVLAAHGVTADDFMQFVDKLTIAQSESPAFQVISIAGSGVSCVPWHWAQLAGSSVQVAARVGSTVVSIKRTKMFLQAANERYFAPRGLKASIMKDEQVSSLLNVPQTKSVLAQPDFAADQVSLRSRRMAALAPYISPLTTDVPPPLPHGNVLDRLSAKQVAMNIKKNNKKAYKKQGKAERRNSTSSSRSSSVSSTGSIDGKMAKLDRQIDKEERKFQSKLFKGGRSKAAEIEQERDRKLYKLESERRKYQKEFDKKTETATKKHQESNDRKQDKNEKNVSRLEYIVIENLAGT